MQEPQRHTKHATMLPQPDSSPRASIAVQEWMQRLVGDVGIPRRYRGIVDTLQQVFEILHDTCATMWRTMIADTHIHACVTTKRSIRNRFHECFQSFDSQGACLEQ